jgi:hypothetical protein
MKISKPPVQLKYRILKKSLQKILDKAIDDFNNRGLSKE